MHVVNRIALILLCTLHLIPAQAQTQPLSGPKAALTIYLAGDSTMAEKLPARRPETGWGEMLQQFFPGNMVLVENHAKDGRSTRTLIDVGLWRGLIEKVNPGDYVVIQLRHNDQAKTKTERYTAPADYRAKQIRLIAEVRERKAFPVLLTAVMRRR